MIELPEAVSRGRRLHQKVSKKVIKLLFIALLIVGITNVILEISSSRSFQFFGEIVDKVETQEKIVALTFDDGPTNKTDEILELREELDVKATFFLTSNELESNIEEGIKIVSAGHEIGNHSYSHSRMIFKILPYVLGQLNRKTIMWSIEPDSCPEIASDTNRIADHVVEEIEPGAIILLHVMYDNRREELKSIEGIVKALREDGYRFKTVSELLEYKS